MIRLHSSRNDDRVLEKQRTYFLRGEVDPSLHYHSDAQSRAWKDVFLNHSPVLKSADFVRIYETIFNGLRLNRKRPLHLIGLGCGTGEKEALLCKIFKKRGIVIQRFTPVDVSPWLCEKSLNRIKPWVEEDSQGWVMDLDASRDLRRILDCENSDEIRIYTLFGLVPNLSPQKVKKLIMNLIRPQDRFLISAHLAPVKKRDASDWDQAMLKILPQYKNKETIYWLNLFFKELGWDRTAFSPLCFRVKNRGEYRSIVADVRLLRDYKVRGLGSLFWLKKGRNIKMFQSHRWTSSSFSEWLVKNGLRAVQRSITPCREEGVWEIKSADS